MARAVASGKRRGRGKIPCLSIFLVAAALQAAAQTVVVDSAACRALTAHQPAPDVAYRPGVDATGRPVAPADLGGAPQPSLAPDRSPLIEARSPEPAAGPP